MNRWIIREKRNGMMTSNEIAKHFDQPYEQVIEGIALDKVQSYKQAWIDK